SPERDRAREARAFTVCRRTEPPPARASRGPRPPARAVQPPPAEPRGAQEDRRQHPRAAGAVGRRDPRRRARPASGADLPRRGDAVSGAPASGDIGSRLEASVRTWYPERAMAQRPPLCTDVTARLEDAFRKPPLDGIVAAYLFGSHVAGRAHRESDVD